MRTPLVIVIAVIAALAGCSQEQSRNITVDAVAEPGTAPGHTVAPEAYERVDGSTVIGTPDGKAACFVTSVNGDPVAHEIRLDSTLTYVIEGWTADANLEVPARVEFIVRTEDGKVYAIPAAMTKDKSRAAEVFSKPELENAGYTTEVDARRLPAGEYEILVKQHFADGQVVTCPVAKKRLVVS